MKRNTFKAAILAAMLVVLVAGNLQAQIANDNVSASATVLTALTITKNTDVAFGKIGATTAGTVYLDPASPSTASTYVGTTAATGSLTVAGANSQSVRLTWPASISLSDGASHTMTYTLKVNGLNASTQASSGTLTLTSGYCDVTTSASGGYYLWVGGNLGTLSSQATGTYTNTANFTVEYN